MSLHISHESLHFRHCRSPSLHSSLHTTLRHSIRSRWLVEDCGFTFLDSRHTQKRQLQAGTYHMNPFTLLYATPCDFTPRHFTPLHSTLCHSTPFLYAIPLLSTLCHATPLYSTLCHSTLCHFTLRPFTLGRSTSLHFRPLYAPSL